MAKRKTFGSNTNSKRLTVEGLRRNSPINATTAVEVASGEIIALTEIMKALALKEVSSLTSAPEVHRIRGIFAKRAGRLLKEIGIDANKVKMVGVQLPFHEKEKLAQKLAQKIQIEEGHNIFVQKDTGAIRLATSLPLAQNKRHHKFEIKPDILKILNKNLAIERWGDLMGYSAQGLAWAMRPFLQDPNDQTAFQEAHEVLTCFKAIMRFEASDPIDPAVKNLYEQEKKKEL